MPRLNLIPDASDTWSHNTDPFKNFDHYPEGPGEIASWDAPELTDTGPVMAALVQSGRIGRSELHAEWRVFERESFVELILRVNWVEKHKILKMVLPANAVRHWEGIMGGVLERRLDRVERPVRDLVLLELAGGEKFGIVCPEVYAADADPRRLRLTLLRSPMMAHHSLLSGQAPRALFSDRGEHVFRFRFLAGSELTTSILDAQAAMMMRPPLVAEWTDGMSW